jgi:hypothetical protein
MSDRGCKFSHYTQYIFRIRDRSGYSQLLGLGAGSFADMQGAPVGAPETGRDAALLASHNPAHGVPTQVDAALF